MWEKLELTNKVFNKLTVLECVGKNKQGRYLWKCQCECGKTAVVTCSHLIDGSTQSCGCLAKKDETGNRYGRLLVLRRSKRKFNVTDRGIRWLCRCDCGRYVVISGGCLRNGHTRSCGCLQADIQRNLHTIHGQHATKEYLNNKSKKRRELKYILDFMWSVEYENEIRKMFPYCVLCGMSDAEHVEKYNIHLHVDHVRPLSKGFGLRPGNAVILCFKCNAGKRDKDLETLPVADQQKLLTAAEAFRMWMEQITSG